MKSIFRSDDVLIKTPHYLLHETYLILLDFVILTISHWELNSENYSLDNTLDILIISTAYLLLVDLWLWNICYFWRSFFGRKVVFFLILKWINLIYDTHYHLGYSELNDTALFWRFVCVLERVLVFAHTATIPQCVLREWISRDVYSHIQSV